MKRTLTNRKDENITITNQQRGSRSCQTEKTEESITIANQQKDSRSFQTKKGMNITVTSRILKVLKQKKIVISTIANQQ